MAKKEKWPKHKQGKFCGYNEFEDGSIEIAPVYWDKMNKAVDAESAVDVLLKSVTEQCHALLIPIIKDKKSFWESVMEDYGLNPGKYIYKYTPDTHIITREEKEHANNK